MCKRFIVIFYVLLALILIAACVSMRTTKATVEYQSTSEVLRKVYDEGQSLCNSGAISEENCARLKSEYNVTRKYYLRQGDDLIKAIKADNISSREFYLDSYNRSSKSLVESTTELIRLFNELKRAPGVPKRVTP